MAEFIRRRERIEVKEYHLNYPIPDVPGASWSPPCDEDGNVLVDTMQEPALKEWLRVQECERQGIPTGYDEPYVSCYRFVRHEPAVIRCECGQECMLYSAVENECECGRLYNGFGQGLRPRHEWADAMEAAGERWDDDY